MPVVSRELHLVARPAGEPKPSDFAIVSTQVADPGPGRLLVRNDWLSVDPYMRGRMNDAKSYVSPFPLSAAMEGGAVGTVIASNVDEIAAGATVVHNQGWREYALLTADHAKVVDTSSLPPQVYLGPLGMPGLTAYVGLTRMAPVRKGDVVFISGGAGAVGIVAARVARHLGAVTVIGSAGGEHKARRLISEFGYDAAIDYRAGDLRAQLRDAAPDGIDVYFDNVGGDHLRAAIDASRLNARFALCGAISQYNASAPVPGPDNLFQVVTKRLSMRGFIVTDHPDLAPEYVAKAATWITDGSLATPETVVNGIDNAIEAFLGLFRGANVGKMLVRL